MIRGMTAPHLHPSGWSSADVRWFLIRGTQLDVFGETFPVPPFAVLAVDAQWAMFAASTIVPAEQIIPGTMEAVPLETTIIGLAGVPVVHVRPRAAGPDDDDGDQCDPYGIPRPELPPDDSMGAALAPLATIAGHEDRGTVTQKGQP